MRRPLPRVGFFTQVERSQVFKGGRAMTLATLNPETKRSIPLRVLRGGQVSRISAEFNGVPYTAEHLIVQNGGTAQPGMGVQIGTRDYALNEDLRAAFLQHLNSAGTTTAAADTETDVDGQGLFEDEVSHTPDELTVTVSDNIVAG